MLCSLDGAGFNYLSIKKERDQVASPPMLAEMTTVSIVINTGEIRELKGTAGKRKRSTKNGVTLCSFF